MWGAKFNLGKFKILGAWNPIEFERDKLGQLQILVQQIKDDGDDFLCLGDLKEKDIDTTIQRGQPKYDLSDIGNGPYYIKDFIDTQVMPECAELIVENFKDFKISYQEDNESVKYTWIGTTIKMVSYDGTQDVYYADNVDLTCIEDIKGERIFYFDDNGIVNYKLDFYKNYKITVETGSIFDQEFIIPLQVGTFYIVEDRNNTGFNLTDVIYPINYGISNATKLDRIEKCTANRDFVIFADRNLLAYNQSQLQQYSNTALTYYLNPLTMKPYETNCNEFITSKGEKVIGDLILFKKNQTYYKWTRDIARPYESLGSQITLGPDDFAGTFRLVGEAKSRRRDDFVDEKFQFEIPLCKISNNTSLNFAAAGEPSVYNFKLKVLRNSKGEMIKLTQYKTIDNKCLGSSSVIPQDAIIENSECCPNIDSSSLEPGNPIEEPKVFNCYKDILPIKGCPWHIDPKIVDSIEILLPRNNEVYTVPRDESHPYDLSEYSGLPYLRIPETLAEAAEIVDYQGNDDQYRDVLLVKITYKNGKGITYLTEENQNEFLIEYGWGDSE